MPGARRLVGPDAIPLEVGRLGIRAVGQLVVRALAMRGIALVGTIALARILGPEDFGLYAVVALVVTLLSGLGDFGIGAALIQQAHEPTRRELATVWTAQQLIWLAVVVAIWVVSPVLIPVPEVGPQGAAMVRVASLALLFAGLRSLPTYMMSRVLRFGRLAAIEVIQQVFFFGVTIVLALGGLGAWSFVIAAVLQTAVGALLVNLAWPNWPGLALDAAIVRRMLRFGIGFQVAYVLLWMRDAVVPIFGGFAGGISGIGLLGFAWRNGQIVSSLDEIVGRVAFPAVSRLKGDSSGLAQLGTAIVVAALAIGTVQAWIAAVAPVLVPHLFGAVWQPAVPALQLVCLGTLATVPTRFLSSAIFGLGQSRTGLLLSAAAVAVLFASFPVLILQFGLIGGGLAFAASAAFALVLHARAARPLFRVPWPTVVRIYLECGVGAAVAAAIIQSQPSVSGLVLSGIAHSAITGALFFALERPVVGQAMALLRRPPRTAPVG